LTPSVTGMKQQIREAPDVKLNQQRTFLKATRCQHVECKCRAAIKCLVSMHPQVQQSQILRDSSTPVSCQGAMQTTSSSSAASCKLPAASPWLPAEQTAQQELKHGNQLPYSKRHRAWRYTACWSPLPFHLWCSRTCECFLLHVFCLMCLSLLPCLLRPIVSLLAEAECVAQADCSQEGL